MSFFPLFYLFVCGVIFLFVYICRGSAGTEQIRSVHKLAKAEPLHIQNSTPYVDEESWVDVESTIIPNFEPLSSECAIVLVHLGTHKIPDHFYDCLDQLAVMGASKVYVLVNQISNWERLQMVPQCKTILMPNNELPELVLHRGQCLHSYSLGRFFALQWFLSRNQKEFSSLIHLEHDNLIYVPLGYLERQFRALAGSKLAYPRDMDCRCIGSVVYIGSLTALTSYCQFISEVERFTILDMFSLWNFYAAYPEQAILLPVLPAGFSTPLHFDSHQEHFKCVFDAAALGQWVGGLDPSHFGSEDTRGWRNKDVTEYAAQDLHFAWTLCHGLKLPVIKFENTYIPVANLHIHSKRLHLYRSNMYMHVNEIIQGNRFKSFCDVIFESPKDFQLHPEILPHQKVVYVSTNFLLEFFQKVLPCMKEDQRILLVSHNSDVDITREKYEKYIVSNPHILKWFTQNCTPEFEHEKLVPLPLGVANSKWEHGNVHKLAKAMQTTEKHDSRLYVNIKVTHPLRRKLLDSLVSKPSKSVCMENAELDYETYLAHLKKFTWVACPRGNGVDTHRLWECVYLDCIPVTYGDDPAVLKYIGHATTSDTGRGAYAVQRDIGHGRVYARMSYWWYEIEQAKKLLLPKINVF